jgi:hypothetical protein
MAHWHQFISHPIAIIAFTVGFAAFCVFAFMVWKVNPDLYKKEAGEPPGPEPDDEQ